MNERLIDTLVPPIPSQTVPYTQILYYKNSLIDVANTAIIEVVLEVRIESERRRDEER